MMSSRYPGRAVTLYFCFITSGMAGLIYQVLWAKYLALYVGSTGLAQVVVLATFMGGLALGSQWLGSVADRVSSPLKMYAFLELGIGLYALFFDQIFVLGRFLFIQIARASGVSAGGLLSGKILSCILSILLPTILMGGTLPAMGRFMVKELKGVGPQISRLYFFNSLGAVFGCLIAGFYLIEAFGLQFSMIIGAALNILAGLVAMMVLSREREEESAVAAPEEAVAPETIQKRWASVIILTVICLSGAVSMMYEVAWIRLLSLVLGTSTYAFSLMLATFILGLTIGSFLLSLRKKPSGYTIIFGAAEAAVGLTVLLMLPFYVKLPYWFNQIASNLNREPATFGLYQMVTLFMCALVMIIPTIFQGITFPAAIKVVTSSLKKLGSRIGFVYAVNTLGTLAGAVAAGFLLLPRLGIKGTLELAVLMNVVMGLAVIATDSRPLVRRRGLLWSGAAALGVLCWYAAVMGPWDKQVLSSGVYRTRQRIPSYASFLKEVHKRTHVFYRDGIDATIAVQDIREPAPERLLIINGKVDASTRKDMATQKFLGHLPMMLHDRPLKIFIVGVGSGATIGSVLAYTNATQIDVVEISRDVIDASRLFDRVNGEYWKDPRVRVYWEDAKTFLQVTDEKYDVIISEPTNPWIAGVAGVFSREYFETCREHLAPGGLFVQWSHAYELEDPTFYLMLETFTSVFPFYTLWNPVAADIILVGSPEAYRPDVERMAERVKTAAVQKDLALLDISSMLAILGLQMADYAGQPAHIEWMGLIHSDYFPVLEYVAPRGFFIGSEANGVKLLDQRARTPANAGLWIEEYLKNNEPSSEDFRDAVAFAVRCPGLYDGSDRALAQEWARRYPESAEASLALADLSEPSRDQALLRLRQAAIEGEPLALSAAKLRCRLAYENYLGTKSFLSADGAEAVLAEIEAAIRKFPKTPVADFHLWAGQIQFDLGAYADAAPNLHTAAKLLYPQSARAEDLMDAGILLCESLLADGRPQDALGAHEAVLKDHEEDIEVFLLKARIQAAIAQQL